eukprot:14975475-Heterocapsa_arctica.AAC.1
MPDGWMMVRVCKWCGGRHLDTMCPMKHSTPTRASLPGKGKWKGKINGRTMSAPRAPAFEGYCLRCGRWGRRQNS